MTELIIFKELVNCKINKDGNLILKIGLNTFQIICNPEINNKNIEFNFLYKNLGLFNGQFGEAIIRWQGLVINKYDLSVYDRTEMSVAIRGFKNQSIFSIEIRIDFNEEYYENSAVEHELVCGELSIVQKIVQEDEIGLRRLLIPAARDMVNKLGLNGDYLDDTRCLVLSNNIKRALYEKRGFSLIRLGDGEGRVLGYPNYFKNQEVLTQLLYYHFGPESMHLIKRKNEKKWIEKSMKFLRMIIDKAIISADIVGLPVYDYFRNDDSKYEYGQLAYATAVFFSLPKIKAIENNFYFGANLFQLAAMKGVIFKEIASSAEKIFIVCPWDLSEILTEKFEKKVIFIKVPQHYTWSEIKGFGQFPDLYKFVESKIKAYGNLKGCLFYVGAGIFGKHYCRLIKQLGGVALDIGSVFDSWEKKGLPYAVRNEQIALNKI